MNTTDFTHITLQEPEAIEFTFDAIGWSLLLVAAVIGIMVFVIMRIRRHQKNKYRRMAIKSILNHHHEDAEALIKTLSFALKGVAMNTYGREKVASLSGVQWLEFLMETCPAVNRHDLKLVVESTFNPDLVRKMSADRQNELKRSVTYWIQHHA